MIMVDLVYSTTIVHLYRNCYGHLALQLYKLKFHFSLSKYTHFDFYQQQSRNHFDSTIRKYGSTFYIGIAMVVLPYFGLWEN